MTGWEGVSSSMPLPCACSDCFGIWYVGSPDPYLRCNHFFDHFAAGRAPT